MAWKTMKLSHESMNSIFFKNEEAT
jgi:hypothetical protein